MRTNAITVLVAGIAVGALWGASPAHAAEHAQSTTAPQPAPKPLSEATKKQIYWEGFSLEHKAMREANAKYPIPDPTKPGYSSDAVDRQFRANAEYSGKLIKEYDAQLLKKYDITRRQYDSIIEEGFMKKWPKPVFKK